MPKFRSFLSLCLNAFAAHLLYAQTLEIKPAQVMIDEAATIRVTGLEPQKHITIEASLTDGAEEPWSSSAEFVADETGTVDTAKQAPVKGSYHIVSAMGLIWSMMPAAKHVAVYRPPHAFGTQTVNFAVKLDGRQIATGQLSQLGIREGVQRIQLKGALHGTFFIPPDPGPHPAVLVVGGSEGGLPGGKAAWLASHGYAALALAYFHYEDLPQNLANIPLEYFGQAIAWLMQRPEVIPDKIAVMGTSRGGELALQLGSMYPQIHAVVAYVPANVRYASCCGGIRGPSWTWKGQPLAYVAPRSLHDDVSHDLHAAIPVEQTHGSILVVSGSSDDVWESRSMGNAVINRLQMAHFAYPYQHLDYPHAGHRAGLPEIIPAWIGITTHPVSGTPMSLGGTPEGNAASSLDAIPKVLDFLQHSFATGDSH